MKQLKKKKGERRLEEFPSKKTLQKNHIKQKIKNILPSKKG